MSINGFLVGLVITTVLVCDLVAQSSILNPRLFILFKEITPEKVIQIPSEVNIAYISPQSDLIIEFNQDSIEKYFNINLDSAKANVILRLEKDLNTRLNYLDGIMVDLPDSIVVHYDSIRINDSLLKKEIVRINSQIDLLDEEKMAILESLPEIKINIMANIIPKYGLSREIMVPGFSEEIIVATDTTTEKRLAKKVVRTERYYRYYDFYEPETSLPNEIYLNISKEKLQPNDVLELNVSNNSISFIKKFEIVYSGWNKYVQPTFHFVQRVSEPKDSTGKAIYPSNFKPAPGAVFYIKFYPKTGFWKKLLSPGFGVNATLLDFEKDNNLELGVGVSVSTIDDAIVFGYGWSLHSDEKRDYRFIGINFIQTVDAFKGFFNQ